MKSKVVFLMILWLPSWSLALDLEEFLQQVLQKNSQVKVIQTEREAVEDRYLQADLEFVPQIYFQADYLDDKAENVQGTFTISQNQVRQYEVGLAKRLTTATDLSLGLGVQQINTEVLSFPGPIEAGFERNIGQISLGFSQSLWKNFFGRSTRLRWQRQQSSRTLELSSKDLERKTLQIQAEQAYWDHLYLRDELVQRKESLKRAQRIEAWVRRRTDSGIGDRADLLNAQGLVALRKLELISAEDNFKASEQKIRLLLELEAEQNLPALDGDLSEVRSPTKYLEGAGERVLGVDAYMAYLEAQAKSVASQEAEEGLKPELLLRGQYQTNGYDLDSVSALQRASNTDTPTFSIGVSLKWLLDTEVKQAAYGMAAKDALASRYKAEKILSESTSSWEELNRRHQELLARIKIAQSLGQIQREKASFESEKLSKGRTVTSQVITAEQDASEAMLNILRLQTEARKLEAQGRLFMKISL